MNTFAKVPTDPMQLTTHNNDKKLIHELD